MNTGMNKYMPAVEKPTAIALTAPPLPPHILLAEDDDDIRFFFAKILVDAGYLADTAEDGYAAWEMLKIKSYQLLITDYDMPKMTGLELIVKLRSAKIAMPIIFISGKMPIKGFNEYSWLYIDAVMAKPFSISDLLKTTKEVLDVSTATRERV